MAPVTNTKSQTSPDAPAPGAERRTETQQSDVVGTFLQHGANLQDMASQQQAVLEALQVEPDLPAPSPTPKDETFAAKEPGETYIGLLLPAVQQGHEGIGDEPRALKDALIEADIDETAALLMPATLAAREEAVDPAAFEELAGADANAGAAADKLAPPPSPLAEPNVMIGDGSDDWLTGTGGVDHIYGRGGTDLLYGRGGNDKIYGEGGDDYLFGEGGADWLYGGGGADYMDGGNGADVLVGGNGDDFMIGGFGIDFFNGGSGSDTVAYAYSSASWLVSLSGGFAATEAGTEDLISIENVVMGSGDDLVYGTDGDNDIKGGEGHDTLIGKNGTNELYGEAGNDFLIGGFGTDLYDGGAGNDTVSFSGSNNDVTVSLTTETPQYTGQGTDTFIDVENLIGSAHGDYLMGDYGHNTLEGRDGNDFLYGLGGNDYLAGGDGNDFLVAGGGNDVIDGGAGKDVAAFWNAAWGVIVDLSQDGMPQNTNQGIDTFIDVEDVMGSAFGDLIQGDDNDNTLIGDPIGIGGGDDWIWGGGGNDAIMGGEGIDVLAGQAGNDQLMGGHGTDAFFYGDQLNNAGNDTIFDFEDGLDKIFVQTVFGIEDFSDVVVGDDGAGGSVIQFAGGIFGGTLTVLGVSPDQIGADDFVFYA